jgi:prepilin-type N-terminal cleavage/methylation domain-containing protein
MSRLRDERGFTLIETLMAAVVGLAILAAAGGVLSMAVRSQKQTADRISAVQNGRLVMELMTRQLRSQVCMGRGTASGTNRPAIEAAEADRVVFYSSLSGPPTTSGQLQIDQRTLRFVPSASDPMVGRIDQTIVRGNNTPPPDTLFNGPAATTTLVDRVSRTAAGAPIFRYWKYNSTTSPQMTELATPLTLADRELVVKVDIAFDSFPERGEARMKTAFADSAFVRTADPTDPEHSPKCI